MRPVTPSADIPGSTPVSLAAGWLEILGLQDRSCGFSNAPGRVSVGALFHPER
jgi:hypothetical protein